MSDFRKGVCQDCNAEFKIPADFPHDRAKCRQCETGVVVIEPAAGPAPVPATAPPKKKPADGMTMKEKILARKKAEAEARAKQVAVEGEPAKGGTKPAAAKPRPAAPAKPAATRKRKSSKADGEAKPARGKRAGKAGARGGGRAGARGKRGADDGGERRGRAAKEEKKSPMVAIIAVLVLVLGGGGAWYFLAGPGKKEAPKQTDVAQNDAANEATPDETVNEPAEATPEAVDPVDDAPDEPMDQMAADAPASTDKPVEAPAEETYDPSEITFDEYPIYGPAVGTTEEEWADIQEQAATFMDMAGGARQGRARNKLVDYGYKAFPAVMNEIRNIDLTVRDGYVLGEMFNQLMVQLMNGKSANWVYTTDDDGILTAKSQYQNRRIIGVYLNTWKKVDEDPTVWLVTAKLTQEKYHDQLVAYSQAVIDAGITEGEYMDLVTEAAEGGDDAGGGDDDLDDLDDF